MPSSGVPDFSERGISGLNTAGGLISDEEYIPELTGRNAIRTYTKMGNDPIVHGVLFAINNQLRRVKWHADPFSMAPADVENASFLESCMNDMAQSWGDFISEALSMLDYGWAYNEICYKRRLGPDQPNSDNNSKFDDSKIGWRKMPLRPQDTLFKWDIDPEGGIHGMTQLGPPDWQEHYIPISKALLFRTTTRKNNPEGHSILRPAYRPWYFKCRIEEIEGVGVERDLAGLPFATVDPEILKQDASADDKAILQAIKEIVTNTRRDAQEGIIFPAAYDEDGHLLYDFRLMSAGGNRQFDTNGIIERYIRQIGMTALADFLMLGHESVGSYALSTNKTEMFATALTTFADILRDTINSYAIPSLWKYNGLPMDKMAMVAHADVQPPDLEYLARVVLAFTGAGLPLFADEASAKWARAAIGMPQVETGTNVAVAPAVPPTATKPAPTGPPARQAPAVAPTTAKVPVPLPTNGNGTQ